MLGFKGFDENCITVKVDDDCVIGEPVGMYENYTVSKAGEGQSFAGVLKSIKNGYGALQIKGHFTLKDNSGVGIGTGYRHISCDGQGGIISSDDGIGVFVIANDYDNGLIEIIV